MTHASSFPLRATTAICAVLALGSTAAWAQDAAPPPDAPTMTAGPGAAPQQPTLQVPDQPPAPPIPPATSAPAGAPSMVSQPVVQQAARTAAPAEEATEAEAAVPAATAAAARRPAARTASAARSTAAAQPAPAPDPRTSSRVSPTPPAVSVPLAQPAVPPAASRPAAAVPSQTGSTMNPAIWIAAIILGLGGGAAAYFATRSRRRHEDEVCDDTYETAPEQVYVAPEPAPITANEPAGGLEPEAPLPAFATVEDVAGAPVVHDDPEEREAAREMIDTGELAPATAAAEAAGEPFTMPAGPIPRGEARDELLRRMVAAPPDAENPFRSRKSRLRRARLILQSLEQQQKNAASEPFDWRTYKPSTSPPAPATPPRVTA